jgi:hypothetical protein
LLKDWAGDKTPPPHDLDAPTTADEQAWFAERQAHLRY